MRYTIRKRVPQFTIQPNLYRLGYWLMAVGVILTFV